MRFQVVTLRVPFEDRAIDGPPEDVPSEWNWSGIVDRAGTVVLDCDPVSENPDVQPIERLPSEHSILCQQGNPDDDCGACDEQAGGPPEGDLVEALTLREAIEHVQLNGFGDNSAADTVIETAAAGLLRIYDGHGLSEVSGSSAADQCDSLYALLCAVGLPVP